MQPAARVGDMHVCPLASPATPPIPHVGGPVIPPGGVTVLIGGQPAARMGDMCTCVGPPDVIAQGSPTVLICGQPAARMGDMTAHGGSIVMGMPTVLIGVSPGGGSSVAPQGPGAGQGGPAGDHESCFECRQRLADVGGQSTDPTVQQAAADMDRLNHDNEHAKLAQHVYEDTAPPPEGWRVVDDPAELAALGIDPGDLSSPDSNFRARVYAPDPEVFGDDMKTTVAFQGTEMTNVEDWKNNLQQSVGMESDYYENAVGIGNGVSQQGADVEFTGHSLGGGEASSASRASGREATTFNSAGLNNGTVDKYGGTPTDSDINAYRIENEVLTGIQEQGLKGTAAAAGAGFLAGGPIGAALGALAKIGVSAAAPNAVGDKYDLPGTGNPVDRHGMQQVIDALDDQIRDKEAELEDALGFDCDC